MIENHNFFGLKFSSFTEVELFKEINYRIKNKQVLTIFGYSFSLIALIKKIPEIYLYGNNFDIMLMDGRWFYLFVKFLTGKVKSDLSLPRFIYKLFKIADINNYSIMLLGADEITNRSATKKLRKKYKNINVFEGINGYFEQKDEKEIVKRIQELSPDILLVGIASPIKEVFCSNYKEELNTSIIIPCGGMIDVIAEKSKKTPLILKKLGLAFIFRTIQEPKRLFRRYAFATKEIILKVIPICLYQKYIKKNENFFLPSIYGISNNELINSERRYGENNK